MAFTRITQKRSDAQTRQILMNQGAHARKIRLHPPLHVAVERGSPCAGGIPVGIRAGEELIDLFPQVSCGFGSRPP